MAPRRTATAAIYQAGSPLAFGVLTNVSETGACVVSNNAVDAGQRVAIKLSFYRQPDLFESEANVVWVREGIDKEVGRSLVFLGVRFVDLTDFQRRKLSRLLDSEDFLTVYIPGSTNIAELRQELTHVLDELGDRLDRSVGRGH